MTTDPKFIIIDLFCGAGGTTTGFINTNECMVIACVNHDANAIKSHAANHPETLHFTEDIRTLDLTKLVVIASKYRALYPDAKLILWASLECTNFSKAKGGQPRDADSRSLADHMEQYVIALQPEYFMVENVVEFMSWGPLDENGKPESRKNGQDYMRWCNEIDSLGYYNEWRELNSANFGAYTSRNRLFGIFAKHGEVIAWPEPTHSKRPSHSLFGASLKKWMPVKDVLDFTDEGKTIFDRKKTLSDKTFERIYAGLIKFVAGGKDAFLIKYNSRSKNGNYAAPDMENPLSVIPTRNMHYLAFIQKYYSGKPEDKCISVDGPAGTITTIDGHSLVNAQFLIQRNTGNPDSKIMSVEAPARTLTATGGNQEVVNPCFISKYHGNGDNLHDINNPSPTVATKDQIAIVKPCFIMRDFTGGGQTSSIEAPAGSVLPSPKLNMVTAEPFVMNTNFNNGPTSIDEPLPTITANRKWQYIINPSHGGHSTSVEAPCPVIIARQDKAPLYLVVNEGGEVAIRIDETDSEIVVKIKEFMVLYFIVDIKMRMLKIPELLKIQGFPDDYKLIGTQTDQKKFIGNSVHPMIPDAMAKALITKIKEVETQAA